MVNDATDLALVTGPLVEDGVRGTQEVLARVTRILEIQKAVMKEGIHFGTIPGTPRPTLYKAGAEKLLMTFRIGHRATEIRDLSSGDEIRYRVTVEGFNQQTGAVLGSATGECSSSEEKYRWARPVCDEEWQETPEDRRREVWKRGKEKPYKAKQVRTAPADVANTILQMADKRGLVQMTRVVLACSDLFDQDLEDMPEALRESLLEGQDKRETAKPPIRAPRAKSENGKATNEQPTHAADITPGHVPPQADTDMTALRVTGVDAKAWKRGEDSGHVFHVTFSDGRVAATFSATMARLAELCRDDQSPVEAAIEESKKYPGKLKLTELVKIQAEAEA